MGLELHYARGKGFRLWYTVSNVYINDYVQTPEQVAEVVRKDEEERGKMAMKYPLGESHYHLGRGSWPYYHGAPCAKMPTPCPEPEVSVQEYHAEMGRLRAASFKEQAEQVVAGTLTVEYAAPGQPGLEVP